jgi:hypothetical protein
MHNHSTTKNKIVRNILRCIARETKQSLTEVKILFAINHDIPITYRFWELLNTIHPQHGFTEVSFCPDCGKFDLQ